MWKSRLGTAIIFLTLLMPERLSAQEKPNFSGAWVSAERTLTIIQDRSRLTEIDATRNETLNYRLDGPDSENDITGATGEHWIQVSQIKWVTNALVITTTTTRGTNGGSFDSMKIYTLDALTGNLKVTTLDSLLTGGPYMAIDTVTFRRQQ